MELFTGMLAGIIIGVVGLIALAAFIGKNTGPRS